MLGGVLTPIAWWRARGAQPDPTDEDDTPTTAGRRRGAWSSGLAVGLVELGLLAGVGALFGDAPWIVESTAAAFAGVAWALVFVRIPPYAGFSIEPAVVAASLGGGAGALIGSGVLWVTGG